MVTTKQVIPVLAVAAALAGTASAHAADYTVDFQSGPALGAAITDEYRSAAFVQFLADDFGFRPARRTAGPGGVIAADIGPSRCGPDGHGGSDCEFVRGGTTFQLTRTASQLTLKAGLFAPAVGGAVTVQLKAFAAGGSTPIASSPATAVTTGFTTPVSVSAEGIQRVELHVAGDGATGAEVGVDDLQISYPDDQVPDVGLSAPPDTQVVPQGGSVEVPLSVVRVNGSAGALTGTVSGLPEGVTGTVEPVTGDEAVVRLTAEPDAPEFFQPQAVTVTLTPEDADVAPAARTATFPLTVRSPMQLTRGGETGPVLLPHCAPADAKVVVARELRFSQTATTTLAVLSAPPGVQAQFVPGASVAPGGGLNQHVTLRLTRGATTAIPSRATVVVQASAPGAPSRTLTLPIAAATPAATVSPDRGSVPTRLREGTAIRLEGNGFCPGTEVAVGNDRARVPAQADGDRALTLRIPRLGTSGRVRVYPPGGAPAYDTTDTLRVDSPRNHVGFAFKNPGWGNLSFGELTDLYGVREMFMEVNPCWPWYDCSVPTPVPDPLAYAKWQIIEELAQRSGGHCFGINRFVQEIAAGRRSGRPFDLAQASVESTLDSLHTAQFSGEFIAKWLTRDRSIAAQIARARAELQAGRLPGIVLKNGLTQGHVITAHDIETRPDGTTVIHTYDNNYPYLPADEETRDGATHADREERSAVVVNAAKTRWEHSGLGWSGGGGSIYATLLSDVPSDPHLPGVGSITSAIIFGSDGSAVSTGEVEGGELLPVLDAAATPGAGGTVIADRGAGAVTHTVRGTRPGSYRQLFVAPNGFVGGVEAPTRRGVEDTLTAGGRRVAFAGSAARRVALRVGEGSHLATVTTRTDGATVALRGGAVVVSGAEGPAQVVLESPLGRLKTRIAGGGTFRVAPASWRTLTAARVTAGGRTTRVRATPSLRTRLTLRKVRGAAVAVRLGKAPAGATAGVTVRLLRGGRVVAKHGQVLRHGRQTVRVPGVRRGRYTLRAVATVAAAGKGVKRVSLTRRVSVR